MSSVSVKDLFAEMSVFKSKSNLIKSGSTSSLSSISTQQSSIGNVVQDFDENEKRLCYCGLGSEIGVQTENIQGSVEMPSIVCEKCGFVFNEKNMSNEPEWNNYSSESGGRVVNKSRCQDLYRDKTNPYDDGSGPRYTKGMTSVFAATDKKTGLPILNEDGKPKMITYDLTRLNIRFISHKQKAFHEVSVMLDGIGERIGTSKQVINTAKKIWHQIMESSVVTRAGIRRGIIANCLIYACKICDCPREHSEIAKAMRVPEQEITKGSRKFKEILVGTDYEWVLRQSRGDDSKFQRLCSDLGLPWSCGKRCRDLYIKHDDKLSSINSKSRVAGIIAWVVICELNLNEPKRAAICKVVNVCAPTLKRVFDIIKTLESKKDT